MIDSTRFSLPRNDAFRESIRAALIFGLLAITPATAQARPNIVFYIADDFSRRDGSVYAAPAAVNTPSMNRLANEGMTFDHAFVASPSCAPSRAAMLTGLMPARNGAEPNHSHAKSEDMFLTKRLQAAGYRVAAFGKVVHTGSTPELGFDIWNNVPKNGDLSGAVAKYYNGLADKQKPVCLFVGDHRPHVTWTAASTYRPEDVVLPPTLVDTRETREHWARYLTDVTAMDTELGQVYAWAKATFGDSLIFVFSSDHGAQWPFMKFTLYDAGIRVPLQVVAPGRVAAGARAQAMVSWVDILPTLMDMAGVPIPAGLDGRTFRGVLAGTAQEHRSYIFTTHSADGTHNIFPIRSVRSREFKYVLNPYPQFYFSNHSDMDRRDGAGAYWDSWDQRAKVDSAAAGIRYRYYVRPKEELYALAADPWEMNNLIGSVAHEAVVQDLRKRLADWMAAQKDTVTLFGTPYPVTGPRPANTDTIRPWQPPVVLLAPRIPVGRALIRPLRLWIPGRDYGAHWDDAVGPDGRRPRSLEP